MTNGVFRATHTVSRFNAAALTRFVDVLSFEFPIYHSICGKLRLSNNTFSHKYTKTHPHETYEERSRRVNTHLRINFMFIDGLAQVFDMMALVLSGDNICSWKFAISFVTNFNYLSNEIWLNAGNLSSPKQCDTIQFIWAMGHGPYHVFVCEVCNPLYSIVKCLKRFK